MAFARITDFEIIEHSMDLEPESLFELDTSDIYSDDSVERLESDDEISVIEAGFMKGYNHPKKGFEL